MFNIGFWLKIKRPWKKEQRTLYNPGPLSTRSDFCLQHSESKRKKISESVLLPVTQNCLKRRQTPQTEEPKEKDEDSGTHYLLCMLC